jgi:hypothetical protein
MEDEMLATCYCNFLPLKLDQVFLVKTSDPGNPIQLTTGKQGSTGSPILNSDATKAAWIQLDEDVGGSSLCVSLAPRTAFHLTTPFQSQNHRV